METYQVGGFSFTDEETARAANKELKAVDFILEQMKTADEATVLKVYNQLLDKKMFTTPVGLTFLQQLRENLVATGDFGDVRPIDYLDDISSAKETKKEEQPKAVNETTSAKPESVKAVKPEKIKVKSTKKEKTKPVEKKEKTKTVLDTDAQIIRLKRINNVLIVVCIAFFLCILGMFYVNSTINSPNILNYEQKLLDKYSSWEQDLTEREEALRQKDGTQ